jgi:hypothetical protein
VAAVASQQGEGGLWPVNENGFEFSLYEGAAGIRWGIDQLSTRGLGAGLQQLIKPEIRADYSNWIGSREMFTEYKIPVLYSFYLGLTGPLLQHWLETKDKGALDLYTVVS